MRPSLDELAVLLAAANEPDPGYSGILITVERGVVTRHWRVWRFRNMARIEEPPGHPILAAGETHYWRDWPSDPVPLQLLRDSDVPFDFELSYLAMLDPDAYWREWLFTDATRVEQSLLLTETQGRQAWTFDAPGTGTRLWVDAEVGLVLRSEASGYVEEWTDLVVERDLTPSFFSSL